MLSIPSSLTGTTALQRSIASHSVLDAYRADAAASDGPEPAPVRSIASRTSFKSDSASRTCAAPNQSFTCDGLRGPTMAAVAPGQAIAQATANDASETLWRSAIGRMASTSARFRFSFSPVNSSLQERQSLGKRLAALSSVNAPVSKPACIGL